jgi:hypothetical protein
MLSVVICSDAVVRQNAKTHLKALMKEKDHWASKCKAMEEGIKPMLDLIGMELKEGTTNWPV